MCRLQAADLAEKSAERTVRVASCEFLHASILWMVGTNARRYDPCVSALLCLRCLVLQLCREQRGSAKPDVSAQDKARTQLDVCLEDARI